MPEKRGSPSSPHPLQWPCKWQTLSPAQGMQPRHLLAGRRGLPGSCGTQTTGVSFHTCLLVLGGL